MCSILEPWIASLNPNTTARGPGDGPKDSFLRCHDPGPFIGDPHLRKTVGIIGYGYVGKAMEALLVDAFDIVVYDTATHPDPSVLGAADIVLICVPTPMAPDGSCDVRHVLAAAQTADTFAPGTIVCIKSAVSPGTTDRLNAVYGGDRFHVSPEYVGEGRNFVPAWEYPDPKDSRSHDFVIVGGPRAGEVLDYFQCVMATTARYVACRAIEAELTKRAENAWIGTKVVFCAEMAEIAIAHGVDWHTLRELWLLDSRVGRSHTAVFTGNSGYSGKCIPKDVSALIDEAEKAGVDVGLLRTVRDRNARLRGE